MREIKAKENEELKEKLVQMEAEMQRMASKLMQTTFKLSEAEEQIDQLNAQLADVADDDVATAM